MNVWKFTACRTLVNQLIFAGDIVVQSKLPYYLDHLVDVCREMMRDQCNSSGKTCLIGNNDRYCMLAFMSVKIAYVVKAAGSVRLLVNAGILYM